MFDVAARSTWRLEFDGGDPLTQGPALGVSDHPGQRLLHGCGRNLTTPRSPALLSVSQQNRRALRRQSHSKGRLCAEAPILNALMAASIAPPRAPRACALVSKGDGLRRERVMVGLRFLQLAKQPLHRTLLNPHCTATFICLARLLVAVSRASCAAAVVRNV